MKMQETLAAIAKDSGVQKKETNEFSATLHLSGLKSINTRVDLKTTNKHLIRTTNKQIYCLALFRTY